MVQYARPDDTISTDTDSNAAPWRDQADGANLHLAIDETSADGDTTHIHINDDGNNEVCVVGLGNVSTPGSSGGYFKYTALAQDDTESGAPGLSFELLEDGDSIDPAVTTTNNSVSTDEYTAYTSSSLDLSGVGDWNDLSLKITMISNAGMGDTMKVTQVYLEVPDAGGSSIVPIAMNHYRRLRG